MRRFVIVVIISIVRIFNIYSEEFRIDYNEGTDQPYALIFLILEDTPGTVEICESIFKNGLFFEDAFYTVDVVALPSHVSYNNKEYIVTAINCGFGGLNTAGPKKTLFHLL